MVGEQGTNKGLYVPAPQGFGNPAVHQGDIYFHTASGARKATGSYFTPSFAVDYLLDQSLEPALDKHIARVEEALASGEPTERVAEMLFDFRVIDPSMGSAHFLVAAVDRIGARLHDFLAEHDLPSVTRELERLREQAEEALVAAGLDPQAQAGESDALQITFDRILNRQVARRCVYGVDVNLMAVELARLAMWIRTFVPGLPMASLGQRLAHGNALMGIVRHESVLELLDPMDADSKAASGQNSLIRDQIEAPLAQAAERLKKLGMAAEGSVAEIAAAREEYQQIWDELASLRRAFDAALARSFGLATTSMVTDIEACPELNPETRELFDELDVFHYPLAFPEVMMGTNPGFDVVLGNPPWEKIKIEEHGWWTIRIPGLRSMSQKDKNATLERARRERPDLAAAYVRERERIDAQRALFKKLPYPMGSGDQDLYKVFCWRDWDLVAKGGRIGVVFPRGALSGSGTEPWRREVLTHGSFADLCVLVNNGKWVFEGVDPRYTVVLTTIEKAVGQDTHTVCFHGPYSNRKDFEQALTARGSAKVKISAEEFASWSPTLSVPALPSSAAAAEVFVRMCQSPNFAEAPVSRDFAFVRELDTTKDKHFFDFDLENSTRDLEVWTGRSFNLWTPGAGEIYAKAHSAEIEEFLCTKRATQIRSKNGAFAGLDAQWASDPTTLPLHAPRIAFRDVARATDTRTVIACLLPPHITLVHKAPYLFNRSGSSVSEAVLVGVMASRAFDWLARRFVETTMSKGILQSLPFPRVNVEGRLEQRLIENSARLAAVDKRFTDWAKKVGVEVGTANDPATKAALIAENDAIVAKLYGLEREHVVTLFETFHKGWDYRDSLERTLHYFDALES